LYQYDLERVFQHAKAFNTGVGNLTLAASQKQTLQCMAGRTNFPATILFPLLLLNLGNLWNFNQINSWSSYFTTKTQRFICSCVCPVLRRRRPSPIGGYGSGM